MQSFGRSTKWLLPLAAAAMLTGCSAPDDGAGVAGIDESVPDPPTAAQIAGAVAAIEDAVSKDTVPTNKLVKDGMEVVVRTRKPRDIQTPRGRFPLPASMMQSTPGDAVATFENTDAPGAILIDDTGTVLVAVSVGLQSIRDGKTSTISAKRPTTMQWSADGTTLLVSSPEEKTVRTWPEGKVVADFTRTVRGKLQFSPDGKAFWALRDMVDFDASQPVRVAWGGDLIASRDATPSPLFRTRIMADVGTLPQASLAWGHEIALGQMLPGKGPLMRLGEDGKVIGPLTPDDKTEVVFDVAADRLGRLWYLRAPRAIENGVAQTARAWMQPLDEPGKARAATAEPTTGLAVSPSGEWIAVAIKGDKTEIKRVRSEELLGKSLDTAREASLAFRSAAEEVVADLREELQRLSPTIPNPEAESSTPWPTEAVVHGMSNALRKSLAKRTGCELEPGNWNDLAVLDDWLDHADGLVGEEPAAILAIAGFYGESLGGKVDTFWLLDASTAGLGQDVRETSESDELTHTMHAAFYVARERLAGRLSLADEAARIARERETPVVLVEDFRPDALRAFYNREAERGGPALQAPLTWKVFARAAAGRPDNDVLTLTAHNTATSEEKPGHAVAPALALAAHNPWNAGAIIIAANALRAAGNSESAARLFELAVRVDPSSPQVLTDAASGLFDCGNVARSLALYEQARAVDVRSEFEMVIDENVKTILAVSERTAGGSGS